MSIFLEILKYTIPSIFIIFIAYRVLIKTMDRFYGESSDNRACNNNFLTPNKIQAYERLVLLLERISLTRLISEYNTNGLSAFALKNTMILAIECEFNHNISQQIYISNQGWSVIKLAKENVIDIINSTYNNLPIDSSSIDLSKALVQYMVETNNQPTQKAIDFLKGEIRLYF